MYTSIGLWIAYAIGTFVMSMHYKRQNRLIDEGEILAIQGVEGFRYAP